MALVCGATFNFPCPVCLVPNGGLHTGIVYNPHTSESMQQVYNVACELGTVEE